MTLDFKPISIESKPKIEAITCNFEPYCDFNFSNIYNWSSPRNPTEYCILNSNLVIKMKDFTSEKLVASFIGNNKVGETAHMLLTSFDRLTMIPEECLCEELYQNKALCIEEDLNNHDYLLLIQEVLNLKGIKHKTKRQSIGRFMYLYPTCTAKVIDLADFHTKKQILELVELWGRLKSKDTSDECNALTRLMDNAHLYNLVCMGIFDGDKLIAFNTNELVRKTTAIGSFGKTDCRYKGISVFLEYSSVKELFGRGYTHINIEQDLGLPGLRTSKRLWRPEKLLKKYAISKRV